MWKHLFNKAADNLERSTENEDECECIPLHKLHNCTSAAERINDTLQTHQYLNNSSIVDLTRHDSRVSADYQQFCVSARRHGPLQLRRLPGWHHRWRAGLCQIRK